MMDITPAEIAAEQAAEHCRDLRTISKVASLFLQETKGDIRKAERLADNFIDLLVEGGVLSTWRYRLLLAKIREGL